MNKMSQYKCKICTSSVFWAMLAPFCLCQVQIFNVSERIITEGEEGESAIFLFHRALIIINYSQWKLYWSHQNITKNIVLLNCPQYCFFSLLHTVKLSLSIVFAFFLVLVLCIFSLYLFLKLSLSQLSRFIYDKPIQKWSKGIKSDKFCYRQIYLNSNIMSFPEGLRPTISCGHPLQWMVYISGGKQIICILASDLFWS